MRTNTTQIREPRISANVAGKQVRAEDSQQGFSQQDTLNDTLALNTTELQKDVDELKTSMRTCLRALEVIINNLYGTETIDGLAGQVVAVTSQGNTEANDLSQHGGSINALRQDMADVGTVLNYLFGDVTNINNQVAKITSSFGSTSDDISDTRDSINEDKLTIGNLVKDGAKLRQGAESMVSDITNMKASVQQLVTDVANNTSAVNTLKAETSKAIDDITELQRAQKAARYEMLIKNASCFHVLESYLLYSQTGHRYGINTDHFSSSSMNVGVSTAEPFTMYNGVIFYDENDEFNSNRTLYEVPYVNFDSSGVGRMLLKRNHSSQDADDAKPVAYNSHVYFYGTGSSTSMGSYAGGVSMLVMYSIAEVDSFSAFGSSFWRIRLGQYFSFGSNYLNITGATNATMVTGSHVRAAVFNYRNSEFFPYLPLTSGSSGSEDSAFGKLSPVFRATERDGAVRCSSKYVRTVATYSGHNAPTVRIRGETDDPCLEMNGFVKQLSGTEWYHYGRSAQSTGTSATTDVDTNANVGDMTVNASNLPGTVSQTSSTPTTSATTPNASSFYSAEFSRGTITAGTNDVVTFSGQENYISVNDMVLFSSTGTLPGGISYGIPYYVKSIVNSTGPQVYLTAIEPGQGSQTTLDITSTGSGTHSAFEITLPDVATANPVGAVFRGNVTSISSNFVQIATVDGGQSAIENGDRVFFKTANTSHATPSGITKNTVLYVRDKANWNSGVRFKLSISATSSAISLGTTITGTLQCYEGAPNQNSASLGAGVTNNSIRGSNATTAATDGGAYTEPTTGKTEINKDVKSIIKGIDLNL